MDFEEYREVATKKDIKDFENKVKPAHWENIPIVGAFIYLIRQQINIAGIDRGPLRKNITKYTTIILFSFLIYIAIALMLLTPWFFYWIFSMSIRKTKEQIENNNI